MTRRSEVERPLLQDHWSNAAAQYTDEYFERGVELGVSLYHDYRWLGRPTIEMCRSVATFMALRPGASVLDYGCAKGYVVKAMRMLGYDAWGTDISAYAIASADAEIARFCWVTRSLEPSSLTWPPGRQEPLPAYDAVIAKDVLEHVDADVLPEVVEALANVAHSLFVCVPLGDGTTYNIREYESDVTHVVREPAGWWRELLESAGWVVRSERLRVAGIKDQWSSHPEGNLFLVADSAAIERNRAER